MTLQPIFKARDFSTVLPSVNLSYAVRDMSWNVIGGCQTATITVTGGENELGGLFARLPVGLSWLWLPQQVQGNR